MSDHLREALAGQDDVENSVLTLSGHEYLVSGIDRVYAAARLVLDGTPIKRCAEHESDFLEREPDQFSMCLGMLYENRWDALPEPEPCRIVEKYLIDPLEEK